MRSIVFETTKPPRSAGEMPPFDLAHWLHEELWEVESEGDRVEGIDCFVVRRARLVRRIDVWSAQGAARFAEACIEHAAALRESNPIEVASEFIDDAKLAAKAGYVAVSAFCCALAAANAATAAETEQTYLTERRW